VSESNCFLLIECVIDELSKVEEWSEVKMKNVLALHCGDFFFVN
jgi:hypothetical protein